MKKTLSLILAVLFCLSLFPAAALAKEDAELTAPEEAVTVEENVAEEADAAEAEEAPIMEEVTDEDAEPVESEPAMDGVW